MLRDTYLSGDINQKKKYFITLDKIFVKTVKFEFSFFQNGLCIYQELLSRVFKLGPRQRHRIGAEPNIPIPIRVE